MDIIHASPFSDNEAHINALSYQPPIENERFSLTYLKNLSTEDLPCFCSELREYIKTITKMRGGHYGASLGVIELTAAIHYVFSSPRDRVVWDTGHQAYAHKALTGRATNLHHIRTRNGPSGFPRLSESIHDAYGVGHTSTSVAAAIGIDWSHQTRSADAWSVVVIGDAAFGGGPALEALNLLQGQSKKICVILNDNGYSIAPNVGALSSNPNASYRKLASAVGLKYYGPMDGHDPVTIVEVLERIKSGDVSCFLHVCTAKGYGDPSAQKDFLRQHMIAPPGEANAHGSKPTLQEVFAEEVERLGRTDQRVKVITAGMAPGGNLLELRERRPKQFIDTGIGEASAVTIAGGLAAENDFPILHLYSTFLMRAADQLLHDIALQALPILLIVDRVGFAGADGPTHHGLYDLAVLTASPEWVVYSISTDEDLKSIIASAYKFRKGPIAVRISKGSSVLWTTINRPEPPPALSFGSIRQHGTDITLITHGRMSSTVIDAVRYLNRNAISCRVIEWIKIHPISIHDVESAILPHKPVIVIEEHVPTGSLGQKIISACNSDHFQRQVIKHMCVTKPNIEHGESDEQRRANQLTTTRIVEMVKACCAGESQADYINDGTIGG